MSLNRYEYVQGNVPNKIDPSGTKSILPDRLNLCLGSEDGGLSLLCIILCVLSGGYGCYEFCGGVSSITNQGSQGSQFERDVAAAYADNENVRRYSDALHALIQTNRTLFSTIGDVRDPSSIVTVLPRPEGEHGGPALMHVDPRGGNPTITVDTTAFRRVAGGLGSNTRISELAFTVILAKEFQHVYDYSHRRGDQFIAFSFGADLEYATESRGLYVAFAYLDHKGINVTYDTSEYPMDELYKNYVHYGYQFGVDWKNPDPNFSVVKIKDVGPCYYSLNNTGMPACR